MNAYTPKQLAERIKSLAIEEAHAFWREVGPKEALTPEHARELLSAARGLVEWHKIMAVLMIGDFYFESEFIDYAIEKLTLPPSDSSCEMKIAELAKDNDPYAVGLWACNLLMSRKAMSRQQYERIAQLPDGAFGKQTLLDSLKARVSSPW